MPKELKRDISIAECIQHFNFNSFCLNGCDYLKKNTMSC